MLCAAATPTLGRCCIPAGAAPGVVEVVSRAGLWLKPHCTPLWRSLWAGKQTFAGVSDNAGLRKSGGVQPKSTLEPTSSSGAMTKDMVFRHG